MTFLFESFEIGLTCWAMVLIPLVAGIISLFSKLFVVSTPLGSFGEFCVSQWTSSNPVIGWWRTVCAPVDPELLLLVKFWSLVFVVWFCLYHLFYSCVQGLGECWRVFKKYGSSSHGLNVYIIQLWTFKGEFIIFI